MPQNAVVTGASTGIGFAIAKRLAAEGVRVHATVRSIDSGRELVEASDGHDLSLVVMDVTQDDSVRQAFESVLAADGKLDILVNNAGIGGGGAVEDTDVDQFASLMDTNAFGTLRCVKAVIPSMRERGSGFIVNVTSLAGRVARPGMAAYNMSKFAQEALSEVLALELRPFGIRVAIIEPGVVVTPIFEKTLSSSPPGSAPYARTADRTARVFMGALAKPTMPDHVADVVWDALTADVPKLRYPATPDAEIESAARAGSSDEAWIAAATTDDERAFAEWVKKVRGFEIALPQDLG